MKEKQLNTYSYPQELIREYYQLANSKKSFLKQPNLTSAEIRKLTTSYEELNDVWHQNHTDQLSENLTQNYLELRGIQKDIERDNLNYKENLIRKQLKELSQQEKKLNKREKDLKEKKANFKSTLNTWGNDIKTRKKNLKCQAYILEHDAKKKLSKLNIELKTQKELQPLLDIKLKEWNSKREKLQNDLRVRLVKLEESKKILIEKEASYKKNISELNLKLEQFLQRREQDSTKASELLKTELKKKLKDIEREYLKKLRLEIVTENIQSTKELKDLFLREEDSYLLAMQTKRLEYLQKLKKYLIRESLKNGFEFNEFVEMIESKTDLKIPK